MFLEDKLNRLEYTGALETELNLELVCGTSKWTAIEMLNKYYRYLFESIANTANDDIPNGDKDSADSKLITENVLASPYWNFHYMMNDECGYSLEVTKDYGVYNPLTNGFETSRYDFHFVNGPSGMVWNDFNKSLTDIGKSNWANIESVCIKDGKGWHKLHKRCNITKEIFGLVANGINTLALNFELKLERKSNFKPIPNIT